MSTDRETTRIVRSWLEDGVTVLPDRVLDSVLDQLPATRQRRPFWPAWRFAQMNRSAQAALGAAALVVVLGLVGLGILGSRPGGIGGGPPGSPTGSAHPGPSAIAVPSGTSPVSLTPGRYLATDPFLLKVGFTVPDGWQGNVGGPYYMGVERMQTDGGGVYFSLLGGVYLDPCAPGNGVVSPRDPASGMSDAELVNALTNLKGVTATSPVQSTIAGYRATSFTLTASAGAAACAGGVYSLWRLPLGSVAEMLGGQQDRLWIVTVGSRRLVLEVDEYPGETAAAKAEVQSVLDSVTIAP